MFSCTKDTTIDTTGPTAEQKTTGPSKASPRAPKAAPSQPQSVASAPMAPTQRMPSEGKVEANADLPVEFMMPDVLDLTGKEFTEQYLRKSAEGGRDGKTSDFGEGEEKVQKVQSQMDPPKVFVRVRPLIPCEHELSTELVDDLRLKSATAKRKGKVSALENGMLTGFEGLFGVESTNQDVYKHALKPELDRVLRGRHVSLFCYGHTGTGKSHTTLGCKNEDGIFKLACEHLLERIDKANEQLDEPIFLRARFTEIYMGNIYDLLEERQQCVLLQGEDGNFNLRRVVKYHRAGFADEIVVEALRQAQTGLGFQEIRLVTDFLFPPRVVLKVGAEVYAPPHPGSSKYYPAEIERLDHRSKKTEYDLVFAHPDIPKRLSVPAADITTPWEFKNAGLKGSDEEGYSKGNKKDQRMISGNQKFVKILDIDHLMHVLNEGISSREVGTSMVHAQSSRSHAILELEILNSPLANMRDLHEKMKAELTFITNQLGKFVEMWHGPVKGYKETYIGARVLRSWGEQTRAHGANLERLVRAAPHAGGTLTLADLAGADRPTASEVRTGVTLNSRSYSQLERVEKTVLWQGNHKLMITEAEYEWRTSARINKELYVLKEVIRQSSDLKIGNPPYRESTLTKVLKRVLRPRPEFPNQVIMVANCSSSMLQERETLNTLKYAQKVSGFSDGRLEASQAWRQRDLRRQVRKLYRERTTKTKAEVTAIMKKFRGREMVLLAKATAKYPTGHLS